jgi:ABC-type branched-subunit amino acid transport system ATPase component
LTASSVSERIAIMVTGQIALETTSAELLADEAAQRRYLGVSAQVETPASQSADS